MVSRGEQGDGGRGRYFLTLPTFANRERFRDPRVVAQTDRIFRNTAVTCACQFLAYCYMPDHLQLVIEGANSPEEPAGFVQRAQAASGIWHAQRYLAPLWKASWLGQPVGEEEDLEWRVRRVLAAPVRAGLVDRWNDWPYSGTNVIPAPRPRSARQARRSSRARR